MHKYLRAIGFSELKRIKDINKLLYFVQEEAQETAYVSLEDDVMLAEYNFYISDNMGICIRGEYDEENHFYADYYVPFFKGNQITTYADVTLERHSDKESYAGAYDDLRVGVAIIFYLQNVIPYLKTKNRDNFSMKNVAVSLGGMSTEGKIIMPLSKTKSEENRSRRLWKGRMEWIAEAKSGNQDAMEYVTLSDMDTYTTIGSLVRKQEDVLSMVDSSFAPHGLEYEQYAIIGDIRDQLKFRNPFTGEQIWLMIIEANEMLFDICINEKDLMGEPEVGRRFKGIIWLQGTIHFPE